MRLFLLLFLLLISLTSWAQTPVLRPRPVTIDLANPKSNNLSELTKEEKKKWKEVQKQKKKELRLKDKLYEQMLDSAQLANYEKYNNGTLDKPDYSKTGLKNQLKSLTNEELALYQNQLKSQYGLPDSVDLTQINDSSYTQKFSPDIQDRIEQQLAPMLSGFTADSLLFSPDSLKAFDPSALKPDHGSWTEQALEEQAQNQLAQNGNTSELAGLQQQEQMMFSSYEEMIASDKYQELMKDMPGKKAEIENNIQNRSFDKEDLPIPKNVFAGQEDKLAAAMEAQTIIRKKPTFKELLGQFFNQDMASVKEKSTIQRFSLSGHVQFSNYDPLFIDYSPSIAYAFTGKARIGTGMTGRLKIGSGETDKETNLFAYRGFLEYDILKNIYLHGEYERTGLMVTDPLTDTESRLWTGRWLLGLGTDIKLPGILNGTILILYNFDDDLANSPNPRRFQVRYGVKI